MTSTTSGHLLGHDASHSKPLTAGLAWTGVGESRLTRVEAGPGLNFTSWTGEEVRCISSLPFPGHASVSRRYDLRLWISNNARPLDHSGFCISPPR
jgi:hypothetical protein